MKSKRSTTLPTLMGVGKVTECGYIPVTYLDNGVPTIVYVGGLHYTDVADIDSKPIDPELAKHALATVVEIVDCWLSYRDNIITNDCQRKDEAL
jgi:hypothetical protein